MVNTEAKEFSYCGSKVLLTADFFERQLLQAMRVATLLRLEVGSEGGSGGILADAPVAGISVLYVRCIAISGLQWRFPTSSDSTSRSCSGSSSTPRR